MSNRSLSGLYFLFYLLSVQSISSQIDASIVYFAPDSCLSYVADKDNNYLPDFSHAGYKNGISPLPDILSVKTIDPITGDNTAHIQAAIDELGLLPLDSEGFRGALLLSAGTYEIRGQVVIRNSGIVVRGVGDEADPTSNTILKATGNTPAGRDVIVVGNTSGVNWTGQVAGTRSTVTSSFIPTGSRSLQIDHPERFQVGDNVIVFQTSTNAWLASINYGDTDTDDPWAPGQIDLYFNRYITDIDLTDHKIKLDAPLYDELDRSLGEAVVYVLNEPNIKRQIGIENLRVVIETDGPLTENHAKNAIKLRGVEDCWLRSVTALHFTYAGIDMTVASRVTVSQCKALQPHSLIEGARRYNFAVGSKTNNVLFERCHASYGRHSFVSNGTSSVSGIVFHASTSEHDYTSSEGHRRWSQGLLFDSLTFTTPEATRLLGLYNRGRYGTGHGWSSVNSVAWNVDLPTGHSMVIQRPPGRQNYAIACFGIVTGSGPFLNTPGHIALTYQDPAITSLYNVQLEERIKKGVYPDAPARLSATPDTDNNVIQLDWLDIASQELGYIVEFSVGDGAPFTPIDTLAANITSFSFDYSAYSGQDLSFRVAAYNESCRSPYSNPVEIKLVVGLPERAIEHLVIYPNPVSDILLIKSNGNLQEAELRDSAGRRLDSFMISSGAITHSISLKGRPAGLYWLKIRDKEGRQAISKIIKQ